MEGDHSFLDLQLGYKCLSMCQHGRQEPKCKGRKKIREKDAVGQTDNDLSLVSFKLVTLLATGP